MNDENASDSFGEREAAIAALLEAVVDPDVPILWRLLLNRRANAIGLGEVDALRSSGRRDERNASDESYQLSLLRHNLRTALGAISSQAQGAAMVLEGCAEVSAEQVRARLIEDPRFSRCIGQLRVEAANMVQALENSQFAGGTFNGNDLRIERVDVAELVRRCLDELKQALNHKRLTVRFEAIGEGGGVKADLRLVHLLLLNLVSNAVIYSSRDTTIEVLYGRSVDRWRFEITNTGPAPSDAVKNMFSGENDPPPPNAERGIGLRVCWAIVRAHSPTGVFKLSATPTGPELSSLARVMCTVDLPVGSSVLDE